MFTSLTFYHLSSFDGIILNFIWCLMLKKLFNLKLEDLKVPSFLRGFLIQVFLMLISFLKCALEKAWWHTIVIFGPHHFNELVHLCEKFGIRIFFACQVLALERIDHVLGFFREHTERSWFKDHLKLWRPFLPSNVVLDLLKRQDWLTAALNVLILVIFEDREELVYEVKLLRHRDSWEWDFCEF